MSTKRKYLSRWVKINKPDSIHHKKCGVVMDEEYIYNGTMCCRVIMESTIIPIEFQYLMLIQV